MLYDIREQFTNKYDNDNIAHDYNIQKKLWLILTELSHKVDLDLVCYLGLYGSQNYKLDNEDSDIDCECFMFPSITDIIFAKPIKSTTIDTHYGTCVIKDIRAMFNELRKSSPNIIESLATSYAIINRDYEIIIREICNNIDKYAKLSEYKLLKGLQGLYSRYAKDCVTNQSCKYYANLLRICEMINKILDDKEWEYSKLLVPVDLVDYLKWVKNNSDFNTVFNNDYFNNLCGDIEDRLNK